MNDEIKNCKDGNVNINNTFWCLILTLGCFWAFSVSLFESKDSVIMIIVSLLVIIIDCVLMYIFVIRRIIRNIVLRKKGIIVHAIVKGYCDDNYSINEKSAQKVLLTVKNGNIEKDIYYKLSDVNKPYPIDSDIELYAYNDIYLIKNERENIRQKTIIKISLVFTIIIVLQAIIDITLTVLNKSLDDVKMDIIQIVNKKIRVRYKELEYEIPKELHLSDYQKDLSYSFKTYNEKHYCVIRIYSKEWIEDPPVEKCQDRMNNSKDEEYEKVNINGSMWCYKGRYEEEKTYEEYMINNGKNTYYIDMYSLEDKDETCYRVFKEFKKSLKLNNN